MGEAAMKPEGGLEAECGRLLVERGWKLAVAESCTGGLVGHRITEVAGSSNWFVGGVLCYDDAMKTGLLGVDPQVISSYGAVSAECATQMAEGAQRLPGATVALGVTGIAGPTGERPGKPVGTTYIALATPEGTIVSHFLWTGSRSENKRSSANAAIEMLHNFLSSQ